MLYSLCDIGLTYHTDLPIYQRDGRDIEELLPWNVDKGNLAY